jgi:hypothetical protein
LIFSSDYLHSYVYLLSSGLCAISLWVPESIFKCQIPAWKFCCYLPSISFQPLQPFKAQLRKTASFISIVSFPSIVPSILWIYLYHNMDPIVFSLVGVRSSIQQTWISAWHKGATNLLPVMCQL